MFINNISISIIPVERILHNIIIAINANIRINCYKLYIITVPIDIIENRILLIIMQLEMSKIK